MEGFIGIDCSLLRCPEDCSGHGSCNFETGICTCFAPYFGDSCFKKLPVVEPILPVEEVDEPEPIPEEFISYTPTPTPTTTPTPTATLASEEEEEKEEVEEEVYTPTPTVVPEPEPIEEPALNPGLPEEDQPGAQDVIKRCTRCRSGREQAENDHREFTRKCNRADGSCKKTIPFGIDDACARGCADHCTSTCKRFHDPKAKVCAVRRRQHQPLAPSSLLATSAPKVNSEVAEHVASVMGDQTFISLEQVEDVSEAGAVAQCYAECAQVCIESCIGQWTNAVPDPTRTEEALERMQQSAASGGEPEGADAEAAMLTANQR